ncbi:MAG: hypothetical protein L0J71_00425, partial [Bifidobacterium crudilactis]|nr:hypothetical protein [Bifidobacterium crudilactis]
MMQWSGDQYAAAPAFIGVSVSAVCSSKENRGCHGVERQPSYATRELTRSYLPIHSFSHLHTDRIP